MNLPRILMVICVCLLGAQLPAFAQMAEPSTACAPYTDRDVEFVRSTMNRYHPRLATPFAANAAPGTFKMSTDSVQSYFDMLRVIGGYQDAHMSLPMPNCVSATLGELAVFPLAIMIREGRIYADQRNADIPAGAEITAINGKSSEAVLLDLLGFASVDDAPTLARSETIEAEFSLYLSAQLDFTDQYKVTFLPVGAQTPTSHTLQAEPLEMAWPVMQQNKVSANLIHQICQGDSCNASLRAGDQPVLYSRIVDFAPDTPQPDGFFDALAEDLVASARRDRAENVILDLRANPGGYRELVVILANHLTGAPYAQRRSTFLRSREIAQEPALRNAADIKGFLEQLPSGSPCPQGICFADDPLEEYMQPAQPTFAGHIWILLDGSTVSAATELAYTLQTHQPNVTIVGSESGGGAAYHSGDVSAVFALPDSDHIFEFSIVGIVHDVADDQRNQRGGIVPQVKATLSGPDLHHFHDGVLAQVLELIAKTTD